MPRSALYDRDFYAWANEQAALLREGKLAQADIENIAEEIESMGRSEKRELLSRLTILLLHLLKWRHQPKGRGSSWEASIRIQRRQLARHMADNPSLKAKLPEAIGEAYQDAIIAAAEETKLSETTFPTECPWSYDQISDSGFWPDQR
ncbi:MAG: DUF29 domain-containing protein [Methylocystaceae bacterium]|nr:MAG: DUF29 domain-containing protein [Methylocystaceae bacterium]